MRISVSPKNWNWIFLITGVLFVLIGIRGGLIVVSERTDPEIDFSLSYEMGKTAFFAPQKLYTCVPDKGTVVLLLGSKVYHPYPPPSVFLYRLFSFLPYRWSFLLWSLVLYAMAGFSCYLFIKSFFGVNYKPAVILFPMLLTLTSAPTFLDAYFGNVNSFMLLLCVMYGIFLRYKKHFLAGVLLSIAFWLKLYPILLMIVLFFDKKWYRGFGGFLSGFAVIFLLSLLIIPLEIYRDFFIRIAPAYSAQTEIHAFNQSLVAIILRLISGIAYPSYQLVLIPTWIRLISPIFIVCALVPVFIAWIRKIKQSNLLLTAYICACVPLVTPIGWGYTFVMIYPALFVLYLSCLWTPWWKSLLYSCLWVALSVPSYHQFNFIKNIWVGQIVYNRYGLVSLVVLWAVAGKILKLNSKIVIKEAGK